VAARRKTDWISQRGNISSPSSVPRSRHSAQRSSCRVRASASLIHGSRSFSTKWVMKPCGQKTAFFDGMQAGPAEDDFNYYMHDGPAAFSLEVAGRISDSAVRDLEQAGRVAFPTLEGRSFVIDLSYVTRVDKAGRRLLRDWHAAGAHLVATRPQARAIVASITGQPFDVIPQAAPYSTWHSVHSL